MLDPRLLEILACPLCKAPVREEGERVVCVQCRRRYPGMIFERVIVPRDCLYVVGENNGSVDSRYFGPVPASGVRGRVITVAADPGVPAVGFRVPPAPKRHASATTPAAAPA